MSIPMSLFLEKDQLMHKGDKTTFAKLCLKVKVDLTDNSQDIDRSHRLCIDIDTVVVDGGWLLRQRSWAKGDKLRDIIDKYCTRVKHLGRSAINTVFLMDVRTQLKIILIAVAQNSFIMTSRLEKIRFDTRRKKSLF